jgi:hypothetical protein
VSDPSSDIVATARYAHALNISLVTILAVWHFAYDVLILCRGWPSYTSYAAALASWLVVAVALVVGSVLLLRGKLGPTTARVLAVTTLLAGYLALDSYPSGQVLGEVSWAWNTVGWCGVLLLMRAPLGELIGFQTLNTAAPVLVLAVEGAIDRVMVARLIVVICATVGFQLLFAMTGRLLLRTARQATDLALADAENVGRRSVDEAVHAGRLLRYRQVRERIEPLLRGLADGSLDPSDDAVRRATGLEAARLRRLFAETDDTPDPLLHELRASADLAERRGLDVSFVHYGQPPEIPLVVRRFLAEVPLVVLNSAASWARLTTLTDAGEVIVSVVADAPPDVLSDMRGAVPLSVVFDQEESQLWVEIRWNRAADSTSGSSTTTPSSSREFRPG